MDHDLIDAPAGLRNVIVADTEIGDVRGGEGFYHYHQYSAIDLARTRTLDDVWFLLFEGRLPDATERAAFAATVAPLRQLPDELRAVLPAIAAAGQQEHALAGLRAALSMLAAARDMGPWWGAPREQQRRDALAVCAATPTILAALHRLRHGLEPVEPRAGLTGAASWLHLVTGEVPAPEHAAALESYLVATMDHGFNASTFTARVVASTGSDVVSAVCAAIGAFTGPLHGGAPDRALESLDDIGSSERIDGWVRAKVAAGERIMGFGHAVYRTHDPRSEMLRGIAQGLAEKGWDSELVDLAVEVEQQVEQVLAELKPDRKLYANVEFYAGVVMSLCGLPPELFTPTFAVSRVIGWSAHALEQASTRTMIRPSARYVGEAPPAPVPRG